MRAIFLAGLLALAACATPEEQAINTLDRAAEVKPSLLQKTLDEYLPVKDENRTLRICLLTAAFTEIETDKARLIDPSQATPALGRLSALQSSVEDLLTADPLWLEADMGNMVIVFGKAIVAIGESKIIGYIKRGVSISTGLFALEHLGVDAVKMPAIFRSIKGMLVGLDSGSLSAEVVWKACRTRIEKNRRILNGLI